MSNTYFIGTLFTPPVQDHSNDSVMDIGNFEQEVCLDIARLLTDADKPGLVRKTIGQHLASAILATEVPHEMWRFQPSEDAKKDFNLPAVNFGATR